MSAPPARHVAPAPPSGTFAPRAPVPPRPLTAPIGRLASRASTGTVTDADLLAALDNVQALLTPPTIVTQYHVDQADGSLPVGPTETPYQPTIPPNTISWIITNLSLGYDLYYWYTDAQSKPQQRYGTLLPGTSRGFNSTPPFLSIYPDPSSTDAAIEVEFWSLPGAVPAFP